MELTKTTHILLVFMCFYREYSRRKSISVRDIDAYLYYLNALLSRKTIYRDIQFLKRAGVIQIQYSQSLKAYIPLGETYVPSDGKFAAPELPGNRIQKQYMEKIIRLCTLVMQKDIWKNEDNALIAWYREHYPMLSDRTRQRDFDEIWRLR